jgi:uncharacterized phosphosugar-binding protein
MLICRFAAQDHAARYPSDKNLYQEADYFINNHLPFEDPVVDIEGTSRKAGPTSTKVLTSV